MRLTHQLSAYIFVPGIVLYMMYLYNLRADEVRIRLEIYVCVCVCVFICELCSVSKYVCVDKALGLHSMGNELM